MDTALVPLLALALLVAFFYGASRQLGRPSGWVGRRVMGEALNQANRRFLDAAVEALDPRSGERIVDVGFGGGHAIDLLRERVAPARPAGVEISAAMVERGRERWGDDVDVHLADVVAMPFDDASCDGVLSVNTMYFWRDPAAALREIGRVLKPSGRVVLGIRRKAVLLLSPVTWFGFRLYSVRQAEALLREAGFAVEVREKTRGELIVIGRALRPPRPPADTC
jgi:arsenite methyltransferase